MIKTKIIQRKQFVYNEVSKSRDKKQRISELSLKLFLSEQVINKDYRDYCKENNIHEEELD